MPQNPNQKTYYKMRGQIKKARDAIIAFNIYSARYMNQLEGNETQYAEVAKSLIEELGRILEVDK